MGKIIKKRVEFGGSSNSADKIKYDDTKNVKEAIDEVNENLAELNSDFTTVTALTSEVGTVSGGYVKVGKVVTVSARIKLTQNVVNNSTKIFDGLPVPELNYLPLTTFNVDGGKNVDGYLVIQSSTVASLKIRTDNTDILSTGYSFMISGSYLSAY